MYILSVIYENARASVSSHTTLVGAERAARSAEEENPGAVWAIYDFSRRQLISCSTSATEEELEQLAALGGMN